MKRKERRKLYTCDKKGLIELINDPKYKGDKEKQFNAIIEYLARNEMVGSNTKNDVFDLAYTARSALIAQEAKEHINDDGSLSYENVVNSENKVVKTESNVFSKESSRQLYLPTVISTFLLGIIK